jgi:hypothetical protein
VAARGPVAITRRAPGRSSTGSRRSAPRGANFSIQATADGDNFAVNVAAATTAAYTAGDYTWAAIVTGGSSEAYEVDRGRFKLLARYDQARTSTTARTRARCSMRSRR